MADVQLSTLGSVIKTAYEGQANTNAYTDAEKTKLAGVETSATADQTDAEILAAVQSESGRTLATDGSKLDGIEANADVTDTANVTAAGAVMDSEVTNLAAVKAFDPTDYAAASHGHTGADVTIAAFTQGNAVVTDASGNLVDGGSPPGGSGTTNITIAESPTGVEVQSSSGTNDTIALANGTNAGVQSPAHYTKVEGVETGATADQSDSEIETAYNNQVSIVSQAEAEAGTATTVRRWTAQRVAQAIAALAGSTATDPSEYDYLNDGNQTGTYTPNFTSNPIIEITLTGDTEIQPPTHSGIASGDAFTGVLIVNPATYTLTFASGITNYNNQGTIATSGRLEFTLSTYDQATSWILAPAPQASEIRNDSGVTGATVSAALDTLDSGKSDTGHTHGYLADLSDDTTPTLGGALDGGGYIIQQYRNNVATSVSGSLTTAAHSGEVLVTSGNVTVPNAAGDVGFNCVLVAGGAHTVTFNSTTSAAMASGDIMTLFVQSTSVIRAVLTSSADQVSFS